MLPELELPMDQFNKLSRKEQINALCDFHECTKKVRTVHVDQYTNHRWNPHPPRRFVNWWGQIGAEATEKQTERAWVGIDAVRAFNCEAVREVYREAREFGLDEAVSQRKFIREASAQFLLENH